MKAFIIDDITKEEEREDQERPRLEIPLDPPSRDAESIETESDRGVVVIRIWGDDDED